jgi:hypothetical protein
MLQMGAKMQVSQSSVAVGVPFQHDMLLYDVHPEYPNTDPTKSKVANPYERFT